MLYNSPSMPISCHQHSAFHFRSFGHVERKNITTSGHFNIPCNFAYNFMAQDIHPAAVWIADKLFIMAVEWGWPIPCRYLLKRVPKSWSDFVWPLAQAKQLAWVSLAHTSRQFFFVLAHSTAVLFMTNIWRLLAIHTAATNGQHFFCVVVTQPCNLL